MDGLIEQNGKLSSKKDKTLWTLLDGDNKGDGNQMSDPAPLSSYSLLPASVW